MQNFYTTSESMQRSTSANRGIASLPPEILMEILDYLDLDDLLRVRLVSNSFQRASHYKVFHRPFHLGLSAEDAGRRVRNIPPEFKCLVSGIMVKPEIAVPEELINTPCSSDANTAIGDLSLSGVPENSAGISCSCLKCSLDGRAFRVERQGTGDRLVGLMEGSRSLLSKSSKNLTDYVYAVSYFLDDIGSQIETLDINLSLAGGRYSAQCDLRPSTVEIPFARATAVLLSRVLPKLPNLRRVSITSGNNLLANDILVRPWLCLMLPYVDLLPRGCFENEYVVLATGSLAVVTQKFGRQGADKLIANGTKEWHLSGGTEHLVTFTAPHMNKLKDTAISNNEERYIAFATSLSSIAIKFDGVIHPPMRDLDRMPSLRKLIIRDGTINPWHLSEMFLHGRFNTKIEELELTNLKICCTEASGDASDKQFGQVLDQLNHHCPRLVHLRVAAVACSNFLAGTPTGCLEILEDKIEAGFIVPLEPRIGHRHRPLYTSDQDTIAAFLKLRDVVIARRKERRLPEDSWLTWCVTTEKEIRRLIVPGKHFINGS